MRLGKKAQYALLFVGYLSKHGQSRVQDVADGLKLSANFLEQIARQLRIGGVVESVRGPGGGYKLKADPPGIWDVLTAVETPSLLSAEDAAEMQTRGDVGVAMADTLKSVSATLSLAMNTSKVVA